MELWITVYYNIGSMYSKKFLILLMLLIIIKEMLRKFQDCNNDYTFLYQKNNIHLNRTGLIIIVDHIQHKHIYECFIIFIHTNY